MKREKKMRNRANLHIWCTLTFISLSLFWFLLPLSSSIEMTTIRDIVCDFSEEEEEEQPQLATCARWRISQRNEQQLRVQRPRRRKPPPCGTSSHRCH
ncbi:hypothetical protein Lal_00024579 [Lupinus albus]|nr:hypothetical protein Lal_00024579 [Lupinus albus]